MRTVHDITDEVIRALSDTGRKFSIFIEDDDGGMIYGGTSNYKHALGVIAITAEETMNHMIPEHGYSIRQDLRKVLDNTIRLNKAVPKSETEETRENRKSFLERK